MSHHHVVCIQAYASCHTSEGNACSTEKPVWLGCPMQVTVVDVSNVQVVHPIATTASTQKPPLLGLELQVSDGNHISCKTDLDSIVPRMLAVFDKAITVTQVRSRLQCFLQSSTGTCAVLGMVCCADAFTLI